MIMSGLSDIYKATKALRKEDVATEKLYLIINYGIKYRMGDELNKKEE